MPTDSLEPILRGRASATTHDAETARRRAVEVTERDLVRRAQDGSVEAFGRIVERYEARVLALLRFRLRPDVDAEDVAQEAFLRAWTRLDTFDSTRPLAPWLLTIATRVAVAQNRKARSRAGLVERAGVLARIGPVDETPDNGVGEAPASVWDAARGCLTEEAVSALWLRYGEDLSMRQIGAALGRNEIHVRVILSRARKRLADQLQRLDHAEAESGREVHDG